MATNSMIPYSNPAGNNQTTPGGGGFITPQTLPGLGASIGTPINTAAAAQNPLIPASTAAPAAPGSTASQAITPTATAPATTTTVPAAINTTNAPGGELNNIFGAVGDSVNSFLGSVSGTDSVVLQDYIKSLQPQMATAQAQTNAALGAGGVSANSSVAAIADANLQAQEEASIAGESASLTESGMQMQESMIQSMLGPAENYTNDQAMLPYEMLGAGMNAMSKII
jgi:hypothetical protein